MKIGKRTPLWEIAFAYCLDLGVGDPEVIPHPVVIMGKAIEKLERYLRKNTGSHKAKEERAGKILAGTLASGTFMTSKLGLFLLKKKAPKTGRALEIWLLSQCLATKGLTDAALAVYEKLAQNDLEGARTKVSFIVGRDTAFLSEEGVTKAAVETVAENFSDGVAAPLFYMMLGGAPLALTYKAINTMDSMVGYKNEKYLHFGRGAAKLDDAANYLPSRLSALCWIAGAALTGQDWKNAFKIWKRDRRNHASPNSAQTESACAGALNVELAGPAYYFGEYYDKPTIGDPGRKIEAEDIPRAVSCMRASALAALFAFGTGKLILYKIFDKRK